LVGVLAAVVAGPAVKARRAGSPVQGPAAAPVVKAAEPLDATDYLNADLDRFHVYQFVQRRPGHTADEVAAVLGIREAGRHLEDLAARGLLRGRNDRGETRYFFPMHQVEANEEALASLQSPDGRRLGEVLYLRGPMLIDPLTEALETGRPAVPRARLEAVLWRFTELGLVTIEVSGRERLVEPTRKLKECLAMLGVSGAKRN
ncbi:MAG: hypothetical protein ACT4PT_08605, partial [Methanobacteriota archaeon]